MTLLFKPMLACSKTPELKDIEYPVLVSPKLDGIRCIMADGIAWTRSMKRIPNLFVQQELRKLELHGLDGELMIKGDFNEVQSAIMSVHGEPDFYLNVFDNFHVKGGFKERLATAASMVFQAKGNRLRIVQHDIVTNAEELAELWQLYIDQGYEGGMVRKIAGPYKRGRSTLREGYLIKLKKWMDTEGEVIGYEEQQTNNNEAYEGELGQTKRSHHQDGKVGADTLGALIVKWQGKEVRLGTGFTAEQRKEIWDNKDKYFGQQATFKYQELTKYSMPRFPVFKGFRYE